MRRADVLHSAAMLIDGDRADQYGDALDTHKRIAAMWSALLDDVTLTAADVAQMMICLKLVRAAKNPTYADSWIDIAGYAALGAEMGGTE